MKVIEIEKNIPLNRAGRPRKYKEYIEAFVSMDPNDSFVVDDYKIVDSVRRYAWLNKITCKFRTTKKNEFRIFKI